jgi:hypothetical protein
LRPRFSSLTALRCHRLSASSVRLQAADGRASKAERTQRAASVSPSNSPWHPRCLRTRWPAHPELGRMPRSRSRKWAAVASALPIRGKDSRQTYGSNCKRDRNLVHAGGTAPDPRPTGVCETDLPGRTMLPTRRIYELRDTTTTSSLTLLLRRRRRRRPHIYPGQQPSRTAPLAVRALPGS